MIRTERVPCPRCGGREDRAVCSGRDYLHGIPGEFVVAECRACGFWYQNPCPVREDLPQLYPSEYIPHRAAGTTIDTLPPLPSWRLRYYRRSLGYGHLADDDRRDWRSLPGLGWLRLWLAGVALVPRFVEGGRVLEIGCGSGSRLLSLRQAGWQHLHGIELVPAAVAQARAAGLSVECGPVEDLLAQYPDASFDVILSSMVIEHLRDPFAVIGRVARLLKPGGQFLFSTVRRDAIDARLYGKYWAGFDFPRHLVYFRRGDLEAALADQFRHPEFFCQSAPVDFLRASQWRRRAGEGTAFDTLVGAVGGTALGAAVSGALALAGVTTRLSCRCVRR